MTQIIYIFQHMHGTAITVTAGSREEAFKKLGLITSEPLNEFEVIDSFIQHPSRY